MSRRVLMVDDDERVLSSYQRSLRMQFDLDVALGGIEALRKIQEDGPFAVIVADMQMPGMNGIQLLEHVRDLAPQTVRMMLTGNADQHTAAEAVNKGQIFRFLSKPCQVPDISRALDAGIEQYRLVTAERDLLDKTLWGAVQLLTELLSMADPKGFGQIEGLLDYCLTVAKMMGVGDLWAVKMATMLGQIGRLTLPRGLLDGSKAGARLTPHERELLDALPEISARLLAHIPRIEEVIEIVKYQNHPYHGQPPAGGAELPESIPLGAHILGCVRKFLELESQLGSPSSAIEALQADRSCHPGVVQAISNLVGPAGPPPPKPQPIRLESLRPGMELAADVVTLSGLTLCSKGSRLSHSHLQKIENFARVFGVKSPIYIVVNS